MLQKSNIILLTILYHFNINTKVFELIMKSKKGEKGEKII